MANSITISTSQVTTKAGDLQNLNKKLLEKIETLKIQEKALNQMWEGDANDLFHQRFGNDVAKMTNFYNAIETYVSKLNDIVAAYEKAENQNLTIAAQRMGR